MAASTGGILDKQWILLCVEAVGGHRVDRIPRKDTKQTFHFALFNELGVFLQETKREMRE
jgi:hypothetical protein